jgi:hypothetical protein
MLTSESPVKGGWPTSNFGAPVELVWRQRRYRCVEPACPLGGFSEDHPLHRLR